MNQPAGNSGNPARKTALTLFWGAVIVSAAADIVLWMTGGYHGHLSVENLPFFGAAAGLLGALAITALAKLLGAFLLIRKEDYYD